MSRKNKTKDAKAWAKSANEKIKGASEAPESDGKRVRTQDGYRETFESIVVAFVLAFLFRAFAAEAFVIPTGSMAPTLFGRHKEVCCEQCKFQFVIGASDEINDDTNYFEPLKRIETAICPNCRFENKVRDLPVFKGDRILVNKFPYEIGDPKRWDVPVFKYPERPTTNYIKRLVGLPNETIIISRGNVFREVKGKDNDKRTQREILRKEPAKQKLLQIPVYSNNHLESMLHKMGWPKRWAAVEKAAPGVAEAQRNVLDLGPIDGWVESGATWQEEEEGRSFAITADKCKNAAKWIRYRHVVPSETIWDTATEEFKVDNPNAAFRQDERFGPRAQLITDFCGYNTYTGGNGNTKDDCFWVSDLTVSFNIDVTEVGGEQAEIIIELNEGDTAYRCRINVKSGSATLAKILRLGNGDEEDVIAKAECDLVGTDYYHIRMANVDDRVCLWIDDDLVEFGDDSSFPFDNAAQPGPADADLIPVGVAVRDAAARVSNLLIERDIYYRASKTDKHHFNDEEHRDPYSLRRSLTDPAEWERIYKNNRREAKFELGDDEYLMLGDNSPRSQDSRVWPNNERNAKRRHAVPRTALVGRAFYIYWPHGVPFLNDGKGYTLWNHKKLTPEGKESTDYPDMRFPFYPNFGRMHRIR